MPAASLAESLIASQDATAPKTEYGDTTMLRNGPTTEMAMGDKGEKAAKERAGWIRDEDTGKMRMTTIFVDEQKAMKEYGEVSVPDDRKGRIFELFENGDSLVEFETPEGPHKYDDEPFETKDVKQVQ